MNENTSPGTSRWPPPLMTTFCILVLINLLLIYLAFDMESSSSGGGDAAGNAMSNGFNQLLKYAALCVVTLPSILFLLIRRGWFRVTMNVLLGLNGLVLLVLASFIHGTS